MAQRDNADVIHSSADSVVDSDLNPLNYPILESNLGRWAQVYFTTPPERRRQAIIELIRELSAEQSVTAAAIQAPEHPPITIFRMIACSKCQEENPVEQKFCGYCGWPLSDVAKAPDQQPVHNRPIEPEPSAEHVPATDIASIREVFSIGKVEPERSGGWKYGIIGVVVSVIAIAGLIYVESSYRALKRVDVVRPASQPADSASDQIAPTATAPAPQPVLKSNNRAGQAKKASAVPAPPGADSQPGDTGNAAPVTSGHGNQELAAARSYLDGTRGGRNPSEAVSLLWKAVAKKNAAAAVLLADMYRTGDGVSQNCDQARLLLTAGAENGSAEAAQQLHNLEIEGCR